MIAHRLSLPVGEKGSFFASQQDPGEYRGNGNLWVPADGPHGRDFGAHGRFDSEARARSAQDWASRNRNRVSAALVAGGLGAALTAGLRRRGRSPARW